MAYKGQIKGFPLIKIKSRDIIEKIQKGLFYMNSLRYYRNLYEKSQDEVIGDPYEGRLFIPEAYLMIEGETPTPIKNEALRTSHEDDFVFCMFGVNPVKYSTFQFTDEQKEKLIAFDDTTLLITDTVEFRKRVFDAASKEGLEIRDGFVQYYDPDINSPDLYSLYAGLINGMENIVFHKRLQYQYQQEYRFTIPQPIGGTYVDHRELNIGDISDISEIFTTKEFLSKARIINEKQ